MKPSVECAPSYIFNQTIHCICFIRSFWHLLYMWEQADKVAGFVRHCCNSAYIFRKKKEKKSQLKRYLRPLSWQHSHEHWNLFGASVALVGMQVDGCHVQVPKTATSVKALILMPADIIGLVVQHVPCWTHILQTAVWPPRMLKLNHIIKGR